MSLVTLQDAIALAKAEIEVGNLLEYYTEKSSRLGVVMYVRSDQGWNPDPFWCQYPWDIEQDIDFNL